MQKDRVKKTILLLLIILGLIVVVASSYQSATPSVICLTSENCAVVQSSSYAFIFGYSVAKLGVLAFAVFLSVYLVVLANSLPVWTFLLSNVIGALYAIYFLSIQAFVLKAFCSSCIVIDSLMIVIAIYSFWVYKGSIKH